MIGRTPLQVVVMTRKPWPGRDFSVEAILDGMLRHASSEFRMEKAEARFRSKGLFRRLYLIIEAAFRQGDVNHVLGDIHFATYLLRRGRTVLTVLDCGPLAGPLTLRKRLFRLLWYRIPARRCAAITVISEAVKRDLLAHVAVPAGKVQVVPVAVPAHIAPAPPRTFRHERPVILQIGTAPNKNVARLAEALEGIPCRLELVGVLSTELRGQLEARGIDYGCSASLSPAELQQRYAECDLVSFVSTFEGFGMPIVEANLVGRPVVTGNVASLPEVAGDAACLVDPFDVASIRAGILRVIEDGDYREQLVRAGRENAKRFDEERISRQYEHIYRQVAQGRSG